MQDDFSNIKKRRPRRRGGRSVVVMLIFINFALWFANGLLSSQADKGTLFANNGLTKLIMLKQDLIAKDPSKQKHFFDLTASYRFLTYGFAHDYGGLTHIAFNMIGLLMFGYGMMLGIGPGGFGLVRGENVENHLGRREFLAFYLLTIIVGGIVYAATNIRAVESGCLGASGGVAGVVILYAWLFPRKTLLLYGILPLPMWAIGALLVFMDARGAAGYSEGSIAYAVHLAGAAFGTLYYFLFLKQGRTLTGYLDSPRPKRKPKLRVHTPVDSVPKSPEPDEDFSARLDAILKRYGEVGESGLTAEEREFLQRESKRYAEKRRT